MNSQLNKPRCPDCKEARMIGFRQGGVNPNPISKTSGNRVCLDCYMDSFYVKFGANG